MTGYTINLDALTSAQAVAEALNVSRETSATQTQALAADLQSYFERLSQAAQMFNLVGPSVLNQFWPRHAFDCGQLALLRPQARVWADLGTGAGLPGLILAIHLKHNTNPQGPGHIHLVESNTKKCNFLRQTIQDLALPASVHHGRAEALTLPPLDVLTARACAPCERLFGYSYPHLNGAEALYLKGQDVVSELTEASKSWSFQSELIPSRSDPSGNLLRVWDLAPKPSRTR